MIRCETEVKRIKIKVLRDIVKLTKEDNLTKETLGRIQYDIIRGERAQYRCCVYHERAIVKERAKLAAGFLPNGDEATELIDIKDNDQIMYVISAACDRCPINKFYVTEACRGCVTHKCMEVCPVHAITRVDGKAYINQEMCRECGMCKKACPYTAISEVMRPCKKVCPTGAIDVNPDDRRAIIKNEDCIQCGACMAACPFGAISDKSYIVDVVKALKSNKNVYAVVAPAIAGQFGPKVMVGQIKSACKEVGFENMVEAACGADGVTVHEAKEFIERMKKGDKYMTNSCCPGLVSYIEKKFPSEVSKISGTVSPMVATGRMIKSEDKDAIVVVIGPCTSKKAEMRKDFIKGAVDYTMTFEELTALFEAYDIDIEKCESEEIDDASLYGRIFAQAGGLTSAIKNYVAEKNINVEFKPVSVSGKAEIKKAMTMAKMGRLDGNFIEGMMCIGGCIGGPAALNSQMKTKGVLNKFSKESSKKSVLSNEKLEEFDKIELEK